MRGLAVGAFYAFVPFPWQMLLAAITALWLRFNLPVAVAMVWITNPDHPTHRFLQLPLWRMVARPIAGGLEF